MKKALLYFPVSLRNSSDGVSKKCLGIIDAFKQKYEVDVFSESGGLIYFNEELIKNSSQTASKIRFYYYNDFFIGQFHLINNKIKENKYDIVYIRFPGFISIGKIFFLYKLKKHNPAVIITVEIATYPFIAELNGLLAKLRQFITWLLIPVFRKYVSYIVTFSSHKTIWKIPAISITNGYYNPELEILLSRKENSSLTFPKGRFNIVMIAQFNAWHAPDILISSLNQYYKYSIDPKEIILHIIGSGLGLNECKNLVNNYGLDDSIVFYGKKSTPEIVQIMGNAQVCIGSLGHHRTNIQLSSSLKTREYAFLGMPIVLKTPDLDFPESLFFVKYFPDDESLLNLEMIISFYEKLISEHPNYKNEIMQYAKDNLTWRKKMSKVFENYERQGIV